MVSRKRSDQQIKMDRIQAAMEPLIGQPSFTEFMAIIEALKDEAVGNSIDFTTVASERNSLVAKGEVLCYLNILGVYRSQLEMLEQQTEQTNSQE